MVACTFECKVAVLVLRYLILALIVAFDIASSPQCVWDCSYSGKSFYSTTGSQTVAFWYRQFSRPTLATAGVLVFDLLRHGQRRLLDFLSDAVDSDVVSVSGMVECC